MKGLRSPNRRSCLLQHVHRDVDTMVSPEYRLLVRVAAARWRRGFNGSTDGHVHSLVEFERKSSVGISQGWIVSFYSFRSLDVRAVSLSYPTNDTISPAVICDPPGSLYRKDPRASRPHCILRFYSACGYLLRCRGDRCAVKSGAFTFPGSRRTTRCCPPMLSTNAVLQFCPPPLSSRPPFLTRISQS